MKTKKITSLVKHVDEKILDILREDLTQLFNFSYSFGQKIDDARIIDFQQSAMAILQGDIPTNVIYEFPSGNKGTIQDMIGQYRNEAGWKIIFDAIGYGELSEDEKKERIAEWREADNDITDDEIAAKFNDEIELVTEMFFDSLYTVTVDVERQIKGLRIRATGSPDCIKELDMIEKALDSKFPDEETIQDGIARIEISGLISDKNFSSTILCNGNTVKNIRKLKKDFKLALNDIDDLTDDLYRFFVDDCEDMVSYYDINDWKEEWGSVENFVSQWSSNELSPNWKTDSIKLQKYMYNQVNGYTKQKKQRFTGRIR